MRSPGEWESISTQYAVDMREDGSNGYRHSAEENGEWRKCVIIIVRSRSNLLVNTTMHQIARDPSLRISLINSISPPLDAPFILLPAIRHPAQAVYRTYLSTESHHVQIASWCAYMPFPSCSFLNHRSLLLLSLAAMTGSPTMLSMMLIFAPVTTSRLKPAATSTVIHRATKSFVKFDSFSHSQTVSLGSLSLLLVRFATSSCFSKIASQIVAWRRFSTHS